MAVMEKLKKSAVVVWARKTENFKAVKDQMASIAEDRPNPDERIDETQKNEVRRFRREIVKTFGQSILEVRWADLAHTIDRRRIQTRDHIKLRHWRFSQTEQQACLNAPALWIWTNTPGV